MVVEVMIPEASLNKIDVGMAANVKIDAFPGCVFKGKLVKIGILPDGQSAQLNPDLKLYKCEIECDFKQVTIRPGMSCEVELIKEYHEKVLYAPVQCVVRVEGVPRVYVKDDGEWVPRIVRVGLDNNRMIHILEGVKAGDQVMLAPPVRERRREEQQVPTDKQQVPPDKQQVPTDKQQMPPDKQQMSPDQQQVPPDNKDREKRPPQKRARGSRHGNQQPR